MNCTNSNLVELICLSIDLNYVTFMVNNKHLLNMYIIIMLGFNSIPSSAENMYNLKAHVY